jgi:aspartyl/asparaginyl beta-hydroxylase (cupin superfamily)
VNTHTQDEAPSTGMAEQGPSLRGSISKNNPWIRSALNAAFLAASGGAGRPSLLEPRIVFPNCREFEDRFDAIRDEVDRLMERRTLSTYEEIDPLRAAEVSNQWKLYYAYMLGKVNQRAREDCPTLLGVASALPNVVSATISVLEGGVSLAAHSGPYAGILRYHLALRVPERNPPSIRVGNAWYTWKERESVVIDDSFEHEVKNQSDGIRVVLIVDFLRPMNFLLDAVNRYALSLKGRWSNQMMTRANGTPRVPGQTIADR